MPRCKQCKDKFDAKYFNQKYCMVKDECIKAHSDMAKDNEWKQRKAKIKTDLMTRSDYLKLAQAAFNTYIRTRDKDRKCISCGTNLLNKAVHASHYYSVGAYPHLRFNEDNVHSSCDYCNLHLHGNIAEYTIMLPLKIGEQRFKELQESRNAPPLKLTIEEIKQLTKKYKNKTRSLNI